MNQSIPDNLDRLSAACQANIDLSFSFLEKHLAFLRGEKREADDTYRGVTPYEVIYSLDTLRLLKFPVHQPARAEPPILLVPSMINRSYVMDLMKGSSLVEALSQAGFSVYLLDWGTPGPQHDHLSFAFYVDDLISRCCDEVGDDTGHEKVALLGYCMAGTMSLIHTALHPERISHLSLLASPVSFHDDGTLSLWAGPAGFPVDPLMDTMRHMDPLMLQASFLLMKPMSYYQKLKGAYESCLNPKSFDSFVHLERWVNDNVGVPGTAYREYVKLCYHDNDLLKGRFHLGDRVVDLKDITCPILNIMATKDHIVPIESSRILSKLVGIPVRNLEVDAGHIGVIMGRKAREMFQTVIDFHSGEAPKLS
jgi:polyhydroxyalkanoate synthase